MSTGSFLNNDGLLQQYGTQKANPEQGGDYLAYGNTRVMEVLIDLASLSTSGFQVQSLTSFFPAGYNMFVEKVEVTTDVTATSSGSGTINVGLGYFSGSTYSTITSNTESSTASAIGLTAYSATLPGVTALDSGTGFLSAYNAVSTAGATTIVYVGTSGHGSYIGSRPTTLTNPSYIVAEAATAVYQTGLIRVRIYYRGYGTIFN